MTQVKSTCKLGTLVAGELRRQYPLCLLSVVALLLAMPSSFAVSMRNVQMQMQYWNNTDMETVLYAREVLIRAFYYSGYTTLVLSVLAVLSATVFLHYLHNRKQTDFYHSLPIGRGRLLLSRILAGLLAVIPAYLLAFGVLCGVCVVYGKTGMLCVPLLVQKAALELTAFLILYAISILACLLTGNTIAALTINACLQFGGMLLWNCVLQVVYLFYPSHLLLQGDWNANYLSPMYFFWTKMNGSVYSQALINEQGYLDMTKAIEQQQIYAVTGALPLIGIYLLAAVLLLCLSVLIYRLRRSERTGTAIVFSGLRLPIKYMAMTACGIGLGQLLLTLTNFLPLLFLGMAAGAFLAAACVEMLFDLDFRAIFSHQLSLLGYLVVASVLVAAMQFDLSGYNTALPERSDIVSANVFSDDAALSAAIADYDLLSDMGYRQWIQQGLQSQSLTSKENIDSAYSMAQRGVQSMRGRRQTLTSHTRYNIMFTMSDGSTFVRSYYLASDEESEEYRVLLQRAAEIRFSKEYLSEHTKAALADSNATQALIVENSSQAGFDGEIIRDPEVIRQLLEELKRESQQLTKEYVLEHPAVVVIKTIPNSNTKFTEQWEQGSIGDEWYDLSSGTEGMYCVPVYVCESETIRLLQEQGIHVRRFDKDQINAIELHYYESMDAQTMRESLDSNFTDYRADQFGQIHNSAYFDDLLTGAIAFSVLQTCDPIVGEEAISEIYEGYLYTNLTDKKQGNIYYCYMKDMVRDDWKNYLED